MPSLITFFFNFRFAFFERQIVEHKKEINFTDLESPPTDYIEAYLKEQIKRDAIEKSRDTNTFT